MINPLDGIKAQQISAQDPYIRNLYTQLADILNRQHFKARNLSPEELQAHIFGTPPPSSEKAPRWKNLDEMRAALNSLPPSPAPPKAATDPETRRREINDELDIIRGVKPTPRGYRIDPGKIKALMTELKALGN